MGGGAGLSVPTFRQFSSLREHEAKCYKTTRRQTTHDANNDSVVHLVTESSTPLQSRIQGFCHTIVLPLIRPLIFPRRNSNPLSRMISSKWVDKRHGVEK